MTLPLLQDVIHFPEQISEIMIEITVVHFQSSHLSALIGTLYLNTNWLINQLVPWEFRQITALLYNSRPI